MFKSRTLFVIGAGASCEAGLPSGESLKGKIAQLLDIRFEEGWRQASGDHQITEALRQSVRTNDRAGDINPLLAKAWRIRDVVPAAAISIDNFLDAHRGDQGMELCGKLGIVKAILDAERGSRLANSERHLSRFNLPDLAGTWYVGFFQMLTENVARDDLSEVFENVSIITFNYDRCIERFLVQALSDYYELEEARAQALLSKLTILHPYGQVGLLPWQERSTGIPFGSSSTDLLSAARQIKTFSEGLDDDDLIISVREEVQTAQTVVFLGFAFHPSNMALLTPGGECMARRIFATSLGLSDADEEVIQEDIFRMLGFSHLRFDEQHALSPTFAKVTGGEFFKRYFRSLSAEVELD